MQTISNIQQCKSTPFDRPNDGYDKLEQSIRETFHEAVKNSTPLFTTNAENLFDVFLENLPEDARQHYTCHACRNFVDRFGGIVTIDEKGNVISALWGEVPPFFQKSIDMMKDVIKRSKVNGVFLSEEKILGTPQTGKWHHMSVALPHSYMFNDNLLTASQRMAEYKEEFQMLIRGLLEYPLSAVSQAVTLLQTESLYRSEKCLGVAEWLKTLHEKRNATKNTRIRENLAWYAVATAPPGWCHVKTTMIGTLLDDIVSGMPFEVVSRRFAEKMHGLKYQRPQAAPSAGNIAQAEQIVEKMGIRKSLERRFARLDEIEAIWRPIESRKEDVHGDGVFSHLQPKGAVKTHGMNIPAITMTWEKFYRTVIPTAKNIEYRVLSGRDNYSAILTAIHDDAPPILQWDNNTQRNPFSQYVYHNGSYPEGWNLTPGFHKVSAICYHPSMWFEQNEHQGKSIIFILDGAKDSKYEGNGNALFPETLKSELHQIRSTIEAYSRKAAIGGYEQASACGIRLQYGQSWNAMFKVRTDESELTYKLDRWD